MQQSDVLEGTWEEINRLHGAELSGRRVRLTVLPDEKSTELDQIMAELLAEAENLEVNAKAVENQTNPAEGTAAFEEHLVEKYRKQGFNL